jgi:uncharacterized protein
MFQEMRRKDRALNRQETEEILVNGMFGVLSMNGGNEYAYGVPLSYVYMENIIYLHCALEGKKLAHIREDNKVSFCVVEEAEPLPTKFSMKYKSVIVFGKIYEVDNHEEKLKNLIALAEKYYHGDQEHIDRGKEKAINSLDKTGVLRIDIDYMTGKVRRENTKKSS